MGIFREFGDFLKEQNVSMLIVAFVISFAVTDMVQSFVRDIIMPLFNFFAPEGWSKAALNLGPVALKWGSFLSSLITFIILSFLVFLIIGKLAKVTKKVRKGIPAFWVRRKK